MADVVAPQSPVEVRLATIWAGLLGHAPVSIHDDFFDLGGHSLMATQLAIRVNEAFHVNLTQQIIFLSSTIAQLTSAILNDQLDQLSDAELTELLLSDLLSDTESNAMLDQH